MEKDYDMGLNCWVCGKELIENPDGNSPFKCPDEDCDSHQCD